MNSATRGPKSRAGLMAYPALLPHAMPMPTTTRPMMNGARFAAGGVARSSVMAKMRKTRIAVPTTWSRNAVPMLTPVPGRVEKMPWVVKV
jgi:hypothetical protein